MLWFCPYRFTYDAPAHRTRRQLTEAFDGVTFLFSHVAAGLVYRHRINRGENA